MLPQVCLHLKAIRLQVLQPCNLKAVARIQDTDYALETAKLTKAAILNQSAMAMVAQANQAQQAILTVIQ